MNLENIVTSLELSQKLKEIGIEQDSLFYWYDSGCHASDSADIIYTVSSDDISDTKQDRICSAFTAQELWDMLKPSDDELIDLNGNIANCLARLIIAQHEEKLE